jgi:hypothetical protein
MWWCAIIGWVLLTLLWSIYVMRKHSSAHIRLFHYDFEHCCICSVTTQADLKELFAQSIFGSVDAKGNWSIVGNDQLLSRAKNKVTFAEYDATNTKRHIFHFFLNQHPLLKQWFEDMWQLARSRMLPSFGITFETFKNDGYFLLHIRKSLLSRLPQMDFATWYTYDWRPEDDLSHIMSMLKEKHTHAIIVYPDNQCIFPIVNANNYYQHVFGRQHTDWEMKLHDPNVVFHSTTAVASYFAPQSQSHLALTHEATHLFWYWWFYMWRFHGAILCLSVITLFFSETFFSSALALNSLIRE